MQPSNKITIPYAIFEILGEEFGSTLEIISELGSGLEPGSFIPLKVEYAGLRLGMDPLEVEGLLTILVAKGMLQVGTVVDVLSGKPRKEYRIRPDKLDEFVAMQNRGGC